MNSNTSVSSYVSPSVSLYNIDCMEYMKTLPANAFDLAIVDPPYGLNIHKMGFVKNTDHAGLAKRNDYKNISNWDTNIPNNNYFKELKRVSKNQIIWGWNYFAEHLSNCRCYIVWDKRTMDKYNSDYADCEIAWTSFDRPAMVYRYLWNGMIQSDMKNKEKRIHPTQKPIALYRRILRDFAKSGDTILDTHLGSASSAIAAAMKGFKFSGCEINPTIYKNAIKRYKNHGNIRLLF